MSASGVVVELDEDGLPTAPGSRTPCAALGMVASDTALTGGEDYELAFTAPRARRDELARLLPGVTRIGLVVASPATER